MGHTKWFGLQFFCHCWYLGRCCCRRESGFSRRRQWLAFSWWGLLQVAKHGNRVRRASCSWSSPHCIFSLLVSLLPLLSQPPRLDSSRTKCYTSLPPHRSHTAQWARIKALQRWKWSGVEMLLMSFLLQILGSVVNHSAPLLHTLQTLYRDLSCSFRLSTSEVKHLVAGGDDSLCLGLWCHSTLNSSLDDISSDSLRPPQTKWQSFKLVYKYMHSSTEKTVFKSYIWTGLRDTKG